MHVFTKRMILALWIFFSVSASYGLTFTVDNITYKTLTDNTVVVSSFTHSLTEVVIPSTVIYNDMEYEVKEINAKGLYGPSSMVSLTISEGIEKIGKNGVGSNNKLKTVILPSTLVEIGESAFDELSSLETVSFPNGSNLQTISKKAFNDCKNLETIQFYPNGTGTSNIHPTFPETVVTIGDYAFNSVPAFKNLILHGELTQIANYTFANCSNIEYIWLKEGITQVGQYSFYDCPNISYVVLPSTLSNVLTGAFTCNYKNGKTTRTSNITFVLLGDEPFNYSPRVQTEVYGLWLPANIDAINGDHFYVKESAIEKYRDAWKKGIASTFFDYKIPFNSNLSYSTNLREFDTDYHVTAIKGNLPFVATDFSQGWASFTSIDDGIVPAKTPVLIRKKSDENTWYQIAEQQGAQLSMMNYLKGVFYADEISPVTDDGFTNYVLYNGEFCSFNNAGFLGDHKAYLQLPGAMAAKYSISFDDGYTNGISEVTSYGQESEIYSINGLRVINPTKGIFIKNGKKFIIK